MARRLGIFRMNEKQEQVYGYSEYLLTCLSHHIERLVVVTGDYLKSQERHKLKRFSSDILLRKEVSTLAADIRTVLLNQDCPINMNDYDELLIFDDSFFGPFFDIAPVFDWSEKQDVDFWGITWQPSYITHEEVFVPAQMQSYFFAVGAPLFQNSAFFDFLETHHAPDYVSDEGFLTDLIEEKGYTWDVYIHTPEYVSSDPVDNYDSSIYLPYFLIKKHKCPILLKQAFYASKLNALHYTTGDQLQKAFEYIGKHTSYNADLIWEYIVKNLNPSWMRQVLNLSFVLEEKVFRDISEEACEKTAVFAHLFYKDLFEECCEYLIQLPKSIDIWITVCDDDAKRYLELKFKSCGRINCQVLIAGNRGRDLAALLISFRPFLNQYEYICFLHDKKSTGGRGYKSVGNTFMHMVWENLVYDSGYVRNIISMFAENPRLGLLAPPIPYHSGYIKLIGDAWTVCYNETRNLAEQLGLSIDISPDTQPFALATCFWARSAALAGLIDREWQAEDFPEEPMASDGTLNHAMERILIYVAWQNGYYSAITQNRHFAAANITNYEYLLSKNIASSVNAFGIRDITEMFFGSHYRNRIQMIKFVQEKKHVCIYGQGDNGKNTADFLDGNFMKFEYFLVSDNLPIKRMYLDHDAFYLSEKSTDRGLVGVIVAVDRRYRAEVIENLKQVNWLDYFIVE